MLPALQLALGITLVGLGGTVFVVGACLIVKYMFG